MTKCDVPELPKNGRVMHTSTRRPVIVMVGNAYRTQKFPTTLAVPRRSAAQDSGLAGGDQIVGNPAPADLSTNYRIHEIYHVKIRNPYPHNQMDPSLSLNLAFQLRQHLLNHGHPDCTP